MTVEIHEAAARQRFRAAYGAQRAAEGRAVNNDELLALPYLSAGPLAKQWEVRARTFDAFVARVLLPRQQAAGRALQILDIGAGNGWLAYRMAQMGHHGTAVDIRIDDVDGLAAGGAFRTRAPTLDRVAASFDDLPFASGTFDLAVFNASLHYATDLTRTLMGAARVVRAGGGIAILDSPFYRRPRDGDAMVVEKRRNSQQLFGPRAADLMALPFVEYLTRARLLASSAPLRVEWRRHRVRYPIWYEVRPVLSALRGRRAPSRFDVWEGALA